jgi:small-conductance mechanosensitive channel
MENWDFWLDQDFWINFAVVLGATLVIYFVLRTLVSKLSSHLANWAKGKRNLIYALAVEIFRQTSHLLLFALALLLALKLVDLPNKWEATLAHGWFIVLALQIALWLDSGVRLWTRDMLFGDDGVARNPVTTTIISILLRILLWSVMLLAILSNLGVNITALVASLGVGGIAVALAVQTLLSDMFASLSIGIDKPFEIGDFVVFGDVAGSIEHIGLKTTRIRSLSGEQIVCSNAELLRQTLHNYKRMEQRRIVFKFGITYDTPVEKVREVAALVRRVIEGIADTRFDRAHFQAFGDYQLTFEVVYFVLSSDYNKYMDIQQEINLGLLQGMRDLDVQFAFPTRSLEFIGGRLPEVTVSGLPERAAESGNETPQQASAAHSTQAPGLG